MKNGYEDVKEYFEGLKKQRKEVIIKFITSILLIGFIASLPIMYGSIVNNISEKLFEKALVFVIVMIIIIILRYITKFINVIAYNKLFNDVYKDYSKKIAVKLFKAPAYALEALPLGEFVNIIDTDVEFISDFGASLPYRITKILELGFILGYFFYLNIYIGLISLVVMLINFLIMIRYGNKVEVVKEKRKDAMDNKTNTVAEIIGGIKEIKNLDVITSVKKKLSKLIDGYLFLHEKQRTMKAKLDSVVPTFIEVVKMGIFAYGILLIAKGSMQIGSIIIIYAYYDKLIVSSNELLSLNEDFYNLKVSMKRLNIILRNNQYDDVASGNTKVNDAQGKIVFNDVVLDVPNEAKIKKVSLEIEPNSFNMIIGHSGGGKTILMELLLKFAKPDNGNILIDDIDVSEYSDRIYSQLVASSRKEPYFFNMSIMDNLLVVSNNSRKVVDICKALGVHEYIMKLPNKYDTVIQNGGSNIPPQQKQLLSIARTILKDPKIIVLDESTNLLNTEMEQSVYEYITTLKDNHTIVMTCPSSILANKADNIIVFESGKVVGNGTHKDLLKNNEYYKKIFYKE